ncbi:hypothetical protein C162_03097 [Paenibacillus sp. FSL R7-269]|uniref:DUF6338 family protein n=1 Tax=Paenibacillus sp. FSL R7-269 TaxID=1226755 RepID=UPI0003E2264D|nr:DUF6338 family protein [Paenibacillus sp. FSL R7-269]ETT55409.1 hypothetical protein C162_03097 [Paenibacillus sp. FSL R7-269]
MDNLLGTIVFILPGFLMYFWLQSFGINPVVKHTPGEFTAIAALLWLPASFTTLLLYNSVILLSKLIGNADVIWSIQKLKDKSGSLTFLLVFLALSTLVSFVLSLFWAKWLYPIQMKLVNKIRNWRGAASFSKNPSVWDEVFTNNDSQVVEIGRIDKNGMTIIGCVNKASRTFEPERHISIDDVDFFTKLVEDHKISVTQIFYDTKSGTYVKIFNPEEIEAAQHKDLEEPTSSVEE